ncbi:anti-sigma factor domain-containing protein [Nocardioides sp. SYSU D00038]|uniref:anti-sigma factor n=1 Tax=Nocardioides sp. SYSU D00038 TaxID=2812554 RepID=UPI001966EE2C|nr:anti-sigma factor [Nocardioides sp. SYSU D00038]
MSEIHALSGAYAVDALDDLEKARFERHLAGCEDCRLEVDSLREAATLLADTTMVAPPEGLRARVLDQVATVRPLPPVGEGPALPGAGERSVRRRFTAFVAAAAAVVAIGVGGAVAWDQVNDDAQPSRVEQVLAAPDAERFTQEFPDGATATVVRSKELNGAVLVTSAMPAAPSGHSYVLWLQHDEVMVPAGVMPEGEDNQVVLSGDAATADGAGITVEEAGVDHNAPEGDVVALFDFGQA